MFSLVLVAPLVLVVVVAQSPDNSYNRGRQPVAGLGPAPLFYFASGTHLSNTIDGQENPSNFYNPVEEGIVQYYPSSRPTGIREENSDWTDPKNACIYNTNKKLLVEKIGTLEECKDRCIAETDFACCSVGYIASTRQCSLSPETSTSPNFRMPCSEPEYVYVERITGDTTGSTTIAPVLTDIVDVRSSV
ncbi:unnamed protein product [Meganyctiphanes norvegica]|uniref:Apple domain-containing protein n=1 Tax=Meganyctiphanes norvegica TaxID=48144 RepID=A0AAV2SWK4_MEGNR